MSKPKKHHYLPVFYLRRWAIKDGHVCRFSRPRHDTFESKYVVPKGTGFEKDLYSLSQSDGPSLPEMEEDFMKPLDSEASDALKFLEDGYAETKWSPQLRSAWSRFIWSLTLRTPTDIKQLKSMVKESSKVKISDLQQRYDNVRSADMPASLDDYLTSLDPYNEDRFVLSIARQLLDHSGICQIINDMHWQCLHFNECEIPLLTSDRPVWMTATLAEEDAFILLPIGPKRLFVATRTIGTMKRLISRKRKQQAKTLNKLTIQHAVKFVYGVDDKMKDFIQKHFATKRHSTHFERLAAMRGHNIISKDSPLS